MRGLACCVQKDTGFLRIIGQLWHQVNVTIWQVSGVQAVCRQLYFLKLFTNYLGLVKCVDDGLHRHKLTWLVAWRKNHAGSKNTPYINRGKGDTLAQRDLSLHQQVKREANVDLASSLQHTTLGHQSYADFLFSIACSVVASLCACFTKWAKSICASL